MSAAAAPTNVQRTGSTSANRAWPPPWRAAMISTSGQAWLMAGHWRAEPGDALQEGREHPSESDDDKQVVATEACDPLAQRVVSAGAIGDLVEQQRRPDHIENEDGIPDSLRARDGNRLPRCGEGEQGDGRSREHPHW